MTHCDLRCNAEETGGWLSAQTIPLDGESEGDRDWRQLGSHLLEISRAIGTTSMLGIGMTSLIRLHTYSIFSGDGLVRHDPHDRGHIERPVSHSLTFLGPGRTCEDFHHVRICTEPAVRCCHMDIHRSPEYGSVALTGRSILRRHVGVAPGTTSLPWPRSPVATYVTELTTENDKSAIDRWPRMARPFPRPHHCWRNFPCKP